MIMTKLLLSLLLLSSLFVCSANEEKIQKQPQATNQAQQTTKTPPPNVVIPKGDVIPIEKRGGDFTLYGVNGAVSLSDYKGKVVAIYFGYTHCPDVCPTNLAFLSAAMKQLSEKELDGLQSIFVSVDPGRDTPEKLAKYTEYFHPSMIGISGTPEMIDPVVAQYGAYYEIVSYSNSAMIYAVSHTSETYIIGKDGKLSAILPHAAPAKDIENAIRTALSKDLQ